MSSHQQLLLCYLYLLGSTQGYLKEHDIVPLPRSPSQDSKIPTCYTYVQFLQVTTLKLQCGEAIESQQQLLFCYGYLHGSKRGYLQEHEIVTLPISSSRDCKILTYYTYVHLLLQTTITIPHTSTLELGISFSH